MRIILLVADEPIVVEGLRSLLAGSDTLLLDPLPFDTEHLAERVVSLQPHVVMVNWHRDLSLANLTQFCARLAQLPIVLLARNPSPELVYQAQEAGLSGLLDARCSRCEVLAMLERCGREEFAFDCPQGVELRPSKAVRMTPREGQLVCLLAQGLKNKEIARALAISEGTVKVYLSKLFSKVGAKDRFELALFGLKNMVGTGDAAGPSSSPTGPVPVAGLNTLVLSETILDGGDAPRGAGIAVMNARSRGGTPVVHSARSQQIAMPSLAVAVRR
jgi:two-component system nitrate/nitrite response regulator NarL